MQIFLGKHLTINLYLLNSKGLLVSTLNPDSIEDSDSLSLVVERIDPISKIIVFKTPIPEIPPLILKRRKMLHRLEWSVKLQIVNQEFALSRQFCTVIAADTTCDTSMNTCSISTFDMAIKCSYQEQRQLQHDQRTLKFTITDLCCSYSYFFSRLDNDRHDSYGSWSVHPAEKRSILLKSADDHGLEWQEKYWVFDLVLHWLTMGDPSEVDGVVLYLLEHEKVHSATSLRHAAVKKRFYRSN